MVYEAVLLFGVLMLAGLLYAAVTRQSHALEGQTGLQIFLLLVLGVYFVWFWTRGGQTLAMQTWRIRLEAAGGGPVVAWRAWLRYLLCWVWFIPALAVLHLAGANSPAAYVGTLIAGMAAYAALTRLHPSRQFWHDIVCGTRLVDTRGADARKGAAVGQNSRE